MMRSVCMKLNLFILFLTMMNSVSAQNLCPNPGFEQITGCPSGPGELTLATPWTDAGSPSDLFNFCHVNGTPASCNDVSVPVNFAGTSTAFNGSSYAGFYTRRAAANKRTYLQAPLTSAMIPGQLYRVTANFRRSTASGIATNRIGISFSTAQLSQTAGAFIAVVPQLEVSSVIADTGTWTNFTYYYTATGGEAFITIGNFRSDATTTAFNFSTPAAVCTELNSAAFYYADGIEVVPVTETLSVTGDTTICVGDSTVLTGITNTTGWWSLQSTPADTIASFNNMITVMPSDTTTYLWHGIASSIEITVYTALPPVVMLGPDTTICDGEEIILDAGSDGTSYIWSTGESVSQISVSDSGTYSVTVSNGYCAVADTFSLTVLSTPEVYLPLTSSICPDNNEFVLLDAGPGDTYLWAPGGDTTQTVIANTIGNYGVIVTHANGCTRTGVALIEEVCQATLFFPGAFTPNNDGKNELYYATGTNYEDYIIRIFNRWGQLVFETDIPGEAGGWNGKYNNTDAQAGLYTYVVSYSTRRAGGKKKIEKEQGYFILWR